jgi:nicotinamide phosphoribosyltransferase
MTNPLLAADSYKHSHFLQYPPEVKYVSAYLEARENNNSPHVKFLGLNRALTRLEQKITNDHIDEAEHKLRQHGVPFNRAGWTRLVEDFDGRMANVLHIEAIREGRVVPCGTPLVQVRNTVENFHWLPTFIETALMRDIWYPSTVATVSLSVYDMLYAFHSESSDEPVETLAYKLHDFGARGVSSAESAAIGGAAHLTVFKGSDTLEAIEHIHDHMWGYGMPSNSIPAAEHSTITSWGMQREVEAYLNMLKQFPDGPVAVVSDSYDLEHAVREIWCRDLREEVLARKFPVIIRPDSGDPVETPLKVLSWLWDAYGGTTNSKGYSVLHPNVRVIQGDGMTPETIQRLLNRMEYLGWSIDNIAVGMGGGLLQKVDRDTLRFAMKASAVSTDGVNWTGVCKNPRTDPSKASKSGILFVDNDTFEVTNNYLENNALNVNALRAFDEY